MALTIDSSFKFDTPTMFKLPSVFKNIPEGSRDFRGSISSCLNFSNNSTSKISSSLKYQLNYGLKSDSEYGDMSRADSRSRINGVNYLRNLPSVLARQRDVHRMDDDLAKRQTFPEEASVSLPTSTTTIEYLVHRRSSRSDAGDEKIRDIESMRIDKYGSLIQKRANSDTSALISRANSDHIVNQFFYVEPCVFTHRMFMRAAKILECLHHSELKRNNLSLMRKDVLQATDGDDDILMMDYNDTEDQIKISELTLAVLKFQKLFEETLKQTDFFTSYSQFKNQSNLVCVILYDLQSRKFQRRIAFPFEQVNILCKEVEEALISKKTRIQSFIAKERVKHNASSIEYLLPESIRHIDEVNSKIPIYMWVNQLKTTLEDVCTELEADGFTKLSTGDHVSGHADKVFQTDTHCSDLLVFPSVLSAYFKDTRWIKMGHLIQQDKTSCLAAESVQYLLGTDKDVIHVNVGTALTTAHLVSLLKKKSPHSHIWGFGIGSHSKIRRAMKNIDFLGAVKNDFLSIDPEEPKLKSVKVILITANCSKSAITNPIEFLINEGEDMKFLGDVFKASRCMDNVNDLVLEHERILKHALTFPRVHAVVYATRSRHQCENESVVSRALEYTHSTTISKGIPFRVTPPVLPFTFDEIDSGTSGIVDRFVRFLPNIKSNGCFVAIISREPEDIRNIARSAIPIARQKDLREKPNRRNRLQKKNLRRVESPTRLGKGSGTTKAEEKS